MSKMITLSGGFHNSPAIRLRLSESAYRRLKDDGEGIYSVVTAYQAKRLDRHFCGIKGCTCGAAGRAHIKF